MNCYWSRGQGNRAASEQVRSIYQNRNPVEQVPHYKPDSRPDSFPEPRHQLVRYLRLILPVSYYTPASYVLKCAAVYRNENGHCSWLILYRVSGIQDSLVQEAWQA